MATNEPRTRNSEQKEPSPGCSLRLDRMRERNRVRVALKRANMSTKEKEQQREVQRIRAFTRRQLETQEERTRRRERERERSSKRRKMEDPSTREQRLRAGRERAAKKRQQETPPEREKRLKATRERLAMRRRLMRMGLEVKDLRKGPRLMQADEEKQLHVDDEDFSSDSESGRSFDQDTLLPPDTIITKGGNSELKVTAIEWDLLTTSGTEDKSEVAFPESHSNDLLTLEHLSRDLAQEIVRLLKKKPSDETDFMSSIKKHGYALTKSPHLGLSDVLCVPVESGDESVSWKRVAVVEEFFPIIKDHHLSATGKHYDVDKTFRKVAKDFHGVPLSAVERFVSTCPTCVGSIGSINLKKEVVPVEEEGLVTSHSSNSTTPCNEHVRKTRRFMRKGQVEMVPIGNSYLGGSTHIGLYIDTWSNYHTLFPLQSARNVASQCAVSLQKKVFPYFGIPHSLVSTLGIEFIENLLKAALVLWPDAAAVANSCQKGECRSSVNRRANRSTMLITQLIDGCGKELAGVELSQSAFEDLLLSIQYNVNMLMDKKSHKSPYELVYGQLPVPGPHTQQLLGERDFLECSDSEPEEGEGEERGMGRGNSGGTTGMPPLLSACQQNGLLELDADSAQLNDKMSRLAQKTTITGSGSGQHTAQQQKQIQQMLAAGTIQAQEQQVTSLRELLRQEEKRLELLKQMRSTPSTTKPITSVTNVAGNSTKGVIRSTHGIGGLVPSANEVNNKAISSRLQQLVDSVAVNQISTQATQLKNTLQSATTAGGGGRGVGGGNTMQKIQPKASTLTIPQNGMQKQEVVELDEATILRTIENSSRYRELMMRQSTLKKSFQKQMDKKIGSAPYPKTFRQVWPIIPVHDSSFVKNVGLECVTSFFETSNKKTTPPSKIKPICNQCACDFASAWQIRKNNSKQVLLCESCDFTNLKLFQRTKLATQLKELMEGVRRDEEKFVEDCDDQRKQIMLVERAAILNSKQATLPSSKNTPSQPSQSVNNMATNLSTKLLVTTNGSPHSLVPSVLTSKSKGESVISNTVTKVTKKPVGGDASVRKRKCNEEHPVSKVAKAGSNLDHTLNKITQQLIRKQVDETVKKQRTPSPVPRAVSSKTKGPPPLTQVAMVTSKPASKTTPVSSSLSDRSKISSPPPLINRSSSPAGSESRKNRRKGTPRQKLMSTD